MAKGKGKSKVGQRHANGRKQSKGKRTKSLQATQEMLKKSKKSLSMFVNMPLDILGEIFKLLSPKDLVNLSNTSLTFRRTLSANNMSFIWRESRQREAAPECPHSMTERDWAILLFSSFCMHCGGNRVKNADFFVRRRLCKTCRDAELVTRSEVRNVDREVFDLIPSTMVNGNKPLRGKYYYSGDITEMQNKLSRQRERVITRKAGARNELRSQVEKFKAEQEKILLENAEARDLLMAWQDDKNERLRQESEDAFELRYKEVKRRFKALGYNKEELEELGWEFEMHKLIRQKSRMTEMTWERIRTIFQPIMDASRQRAIELEIRKLRARRRDIVERLYAQFKLTVPPHLWMYLPSVYNICRLGPFPSLVEADAGISVAVAEFEACMGMLPQLIVEAYEGTKSHLRQIVSAAKHPIHEGIDCTEDYQELELATMVFQCGSCREFVVGFDSGVKRHNCLPEVGLSWGYPEKEPPLHNEFPSPFNLSAEGASVAAQVLESLGLDPKSAFISQLGENDYAFRCLECLQDHRKSAKYAYSWVAMISHAVTRHRRLIHNQSYPGCDLLPSEFMSKYKEEIKQGAACKRWACTHCTWHAIGRDAERHHDAISHLERHNITNAENGVDIVMMDQPRVAFMYATRHWFDSDMSDSDSEEEEED